MRSRRTAIPLLFFCASSGGCMRTLPPAPGVAVVSQAKGSPLHEMDARPPAEDADEDEGGDDAEYVVPCEDGSFVQHTAEVAIDAFGEKVRVLSDSADPTPLAEELENLLEHPCLELANVDPKEALTFPNAVSLRHWWSEGGYDWLHSYVSVDFRRYLRIAPTPRDALTLETAPKDHPLAPLLCPADVSKPCAVESAGWARRAHEKLELVATRRHRGPDEIECAGEAAKEPKADRYATYRSCLERMFASQDALPIGRFKAPSDGWLVIAEQHRACSHVRAFDLATGSAYATNDCHRSTPTIGRVPVGALREAAWMLALAGEAQEKVRFSQGFHVPERIPIKRTRGLGSIGLGVIGCSCGSSGRRSWSWMREKGGVLRGQISGVIVGQADNDAMQHAFDLLDIAEAAFEKGCAPAAPPARIAWSSPGAATKDHEAAVLDEPSSDAVRAALLKLRPPRLCPAKP